MAIVCIHLARRPDTGEIDRDAPFMVIEEGPERELAYVSERNGVYCDEPGVIAQLAPDESEARFEAEWMNSQWRFGKRVQDA